jgi:hypothetical protein
LCSRIAASIIEKQDLGEKGKMPKKINSTPIETNEAVVINNTEKPSINSPEWTDYVLSLLMEDEKISDNPTTDGLRRIFEIALNCRLVSSTSTVVQSPEPSNEKRATVVHSITYILKPATEETISFNTITVDGAADVYWGNCDKIYRNHPVAVAETRAEGRALRRALRLKKVVAAEELAKEVEDVDGSTVSKITNNQINFIDVLSKRLDVDVVKLIKEMNIDTTNIHSISHEDAVSVVQKLSEYQQDILSIPEHIKPYNGSWK